MNQMGGLIEHTAEPLPTTTVMTSSVQPHTVPECESEPSGCFNSCSMTLQNVVSPAGFLLDFISFPVIKGFTCAAAVTIGFGQIKVSFSIHTHTVYE